MYCPPPGEEPRMTLHSIRRTRDSDRAEREREREGRGTLVQSCNPPTSNASFADFRFQTPSGPFWPFCVRVGGTGRKPEITSTVRLVRTLQSQSQVSRWTSPTGERKRTQQPTTSKPQRGLESEREHGAQAQPPHHPLPSAKASRALPSTFCPAQQRHPLPFLRAAIFSPVSYTHLTLPTTPYV